MPQRLLILFIVWLGMTSVSYADLMIFRNGDFKYGTVQKVVGGYTLTTPDGKAQFFKDIQVQEVVIGVQQPTTGQIVQATDFIHEATTTIWSITEEITVSTTITTDDEKEVFLEVENGYEIPKFVIYPTSYPFFGRRGAFFTALIVNNTPNDIYGIDFRIYFYNQEDKLMITKDFYSNRLPATQPGQRPFARRFSVSLPDVPVESIKRVRLVRKF